MADMQKVSGIIHIPNEFVKQLLHFILGPLDLEIILSVLLLTKGTGRETAPVSLEDIAKLTEARKNSIGRSLSKLIGLGIIKVFSPSHGVHSRIIGVNRNFNEWDKSMLKGKASLPGRRRHLESTHRRLSESTRRRLLESTPRRVSEEKEKESIKEKEKEILIPTSEIINPSVISVGNIISIIPENNDDNNAEILNNLDQKLLALYMSCFNHQPNIYQIELIKKEIFMDTRFDPIESVKIIQESFHKVATCDAEKRNTRYVISVIKSRKLEIMQLREKKKKEEEKKQLQEQIKHTQDEYVPGTFMGMYYEGMKRGKGE